MEEIAPSRNRRSRGSDPCVFCNKRIAILAVHKKVAKLCRACFDVVMAENLWKQLGISYKTMPTTGLMPMEPAAFAAEYRRLWDLGLRSKHMADKWGVTRVQVWAKATAARELGHVVPSTRSTMRDRSREVPLKPRGRGTPKNDHGQGARGKRDCNEGPTGGACRLCLDAQRRWRQARRGAGKDQYKS